MAHIYILMGSFRGMKGNHKEKEESFILVRSRSRLYEVVLLKLRTCLNNFSITPETFEGTPHRAGNKGHDPWVKSVTR